MTPYMEGNLGGGRHLQATVAIKTGRTAMGLQHRVGLSLGGIGVRDNHFTPGLTPLPHLPLWVV